MANQIVVSAGAKVRNLSGVLTATSGVVSFLPIDVSLGIPQLDVNGKILVSQLPNSVMEYKGTWDASTNTPTLANGTGNQGDVYLCNVAGTTNFGAGAIAFFVGDQVIYSGSIWQRASGATGTVTSVALTESGDSLNITGSPITTSGTINIGFNGTNLQYVNGAGNLTTFPILTGYVTAVSGTAPVVSSGGTTPAISMAAATGSVDGYLLATDFAIFSAKQSALTFSSPLVNTSGTISIPAATTSVNGYLASADFTTFNNKQNAITLTTTGSSGVSTLVGATLNIPDYGSALTGYVTLATTQTITGAKTFSGYTTFTSTVDITSGLTFSNSGFTLLLQPPTLSVNRTVTLPNATGTLALTSDISYPVSSVFGRTGAVVATNGDYTTAQVTESGNLYFTDSRARLALSGSTGISYNNTTGVITNSAPDQVVALTASTGISVTGTYPNFTITNTSPSSGGTVTSVAALTIGTTGTDLSSTVATSTTTPVITLNVPTASAANRGALSSADWSTFNSKQGTITLTTTGTSGAATFTSNTLNIPNYGSALSGYLPLTGGTLTGALGGTSASFSSSVTATGGASSGFVLNYNADASSRSWAILNDQVLFGDFQIQQSTTQTGGTRATKFYINPSGNVGIGTVSPNAILEVGGLVADVTKTVFRSSLAVAPTAYFNDITAIYSGASAQANKLQINYANGYTSGTGIVLQGDGNVGIGISAPLARLHILAPTNDIVLRFQQQNDPTSQYYFNIDSAVNGALSLVTNYLGGAVVGFSQSRAANVGIGTSTDSGYKLDVNGTGRFSGNLTCSNASTPRIIADGLSGQYAAFNLYFSGAEKGAFYADNTNKFILVGGTGDATYGTKILYGNGSLGLTLASTGAATFSSTVTATSYNRSAAGTGFLNGKFDAVEGVSTTGPIYCIGDSWVPTSTSLNTMYGIGYSYNNFTGKFGPADTWGMYVAGGGISGIFLAADGRAYFAGAVTATGFFESSDSRLKTLIQDNYQTKGITSITPKLYTKNGKVELGYYAQDFVGILDSAVSKGSDDMLSLSYREVLVAKVYALEQRIKELETK